MSPVERHDELGRLAAALCDGEITAADARRLEQLASQSPEARRYLIDYLQLHGELHWDHALGAGADIAATLGKPLAPEEFARGTRRAGRGKPGMRLLSLLATLVASIAVAIIGWRAIPLQREPRARPGEPSGAGFVAQVTATADARWAVGTDQRYRNRRLSAGQGVQLQAGLAEVTFDSGIRIVLQGPADLHVDSADGAFLVSGAAVTTVPASADRFTLRTTTLVLVAADAEFGIAVAENGNNEIHVFSGEVDARPTAPATPLDRRLSAGEAFTVSPAPGETIAFAESGVPARQFVRTMPAPDSLPGSVAALRSQVERNPHLIHLWTFEGTTREEKWRDKQDGLHLMEAVMAGGRGGGAIDYSIPGPDPTSEAIRTFRGPVDGDSNGVALQSEGRFQPPAEMTVEVLLNFAGFGGEATGVAAVVATRDSHRNCGFLIAVADDGHLVHLFDGDAEWTAGGFVLTPGEWYYIASTFRSGSEQTTINTYAANLSRAERQLTRILTDAVAPGVPPPGRLGVGKGLDNTLAHAYPWSGRIDELAIYDAILDVQTLQEHLKRLTTPLK